MLRSDYDHIQRLMWDASLRRRFVAQPSGEVVTGLAPELGRHLSAREVAGVEEAAYYRIASCSRALASVFEHGAVLLNAFGGLPYLETLLAGYLDAPTPKHATYELFDGYVLGPEAMRVARQFHFEEGAQWVADLLEAEWAMWHSRRCALGWKPLLAPPPGFKRPAQLVNVPFELQALIDDIVRMRAAKVPEAVYRWRCQPNFNHTTQLLVYAHETDVAVLELDPASFESVQDYVAGHHGALPAELKELLQAQGVL